jgi:hypothetical protein
VQAVGWLLLFPIVASLAMTKGRREPVARLIAGAAVFVVTAPVWRVAATAGEGGSSSNLAAPLINVAYTVAEDSKPLTVASSERFNSHA